MMTNTRKRKPSDDLSDEQRFAKRFDLLNIGPFTVLRTNRYGS